MTVTIRAAEPSDFSDQERERFQELVVKGGEVVGAALTTNIANARVLVMLSEDNVIQGVAALKRPQDSYRQKISTAAFDLPKTAYPFELGYIYIEPELRGRRLSSRLATEALEHGFEKIDLRDRPDGQCPDASNLGQSGLSKCRIALSGSSGQHDRHLGQAGARVIVRSATRAARKTAGGTFLTFLSGVSNGICCKKPTSSGYPGGIGAIPIGVLQASSISHFS